MKTHNLKNHASVIANKKSIVGFAAIAALVIGLNANAGSYSVTYTVSGSSSTGATPEPSSPSVYFPVYTSGTKGSLWGTMTCQATYTWVPDGDGDNPPASIEVEEFVDVGVEVYGTGLYNPQMSDPFNDPETIEYDTTTDIDEYKETNPGAGHDYIQNNPGLSFTSPPRTISSSVDGTTIGDEVYLEYEATTFQE